MTQSNNPDWICAECGRRCEEKATPSLFSERLCATCACDPVPAFDLADHDAPYWQTYGHYEDTTQWQWKRDRRFGKTPYYDSLNLDRLFDDFSDAMEDVLLEDAERITSFLEDKADEDTLSEYFESHGLDPDTPIADFVDWLLAQEASSPKSVKDALKLLTDDGDYWEWVNDAAQFEWEVSMEQDLDIDDDLSVALWEDSMLCVDKDNSSVFGELYTAFDQWRNRNYAFAETYRKMDVLCRIEPCVLDSRVYADDNMAELIGLYYDNGDIISAVDVETLLNVSDDQPSRLYDDWDKLNYLRLGWLMLLHARGRLPVSYSFLQQHGWFFHPVEMKEKPACFGNWLDGYLIKKEISK